MTRIEHWIIENIHRDFTDKKVFITGSNSGIGFQLALILASLKAHVYILGRNEDKCLNAKDEILKQYPDSKVDNFTLDLSDFNSIDDFIKQIKENKIDIDIFINNAGVFNIPKQYNSNHYELVMMTNYLGVKYLNDKLLDYLTTLNHKCEVIITTSVAAHLGKLNYGDFFLEKRYSKMIAYGNSKLCCLHYYLHCLDKYQNSNISFYLTHPGASFTPLIVKAYPKAFAFFAKIFMKLVFHNPKKACLSMLFALEKEKNNSYYAPKGFLHLSGFPKEFKIPNKMMIDYIKTDQVADSLIAEVTSK